MTHFCTKEERPKGLSPAAGLRNVGEASWEPCPSWGPSPLARLGVPVPNPCGDLLRLERLAHGPIQVASGLRLLMGKAMVPTFPARQQASPIYMQGEHHGNKGRFCFCDTSLTSLLCLLLRLLNPGWQFLELVLDQAPETRARARLTLLMAGWKSPQCPLSEVFSPTLSHTQGLSNTHTHTHTHARAHVR